mgnify:FL=1
MKKYIIFSVIAFWSTSFSPLTAQVISPDSVARMVENSMSGKYVDYKLMKRASDSLESQLPKYFIQMARLEMAEAWNQPEVVEALTDSLLFHTSRNEIDGNFAAFYLNKKAQAYLFNGKYKELEKWLDKVSARWKDAPQIVPLKQHFQNICQAAEGIGTVRISRPQKNVCIPLVQDPDMGNFDHIRQMEITLNGRDTRFISMDTGNPNSIILGKEFATKAGVRLLPDTIPCTLIHITNIPIPIQRGVIDSLSFGGITYYNLPVWVTLTENPVIRNGILGTPELLRLGKVEISPDKLVIPVKEEDAQTKSAPNFHIKTVSGAAVYLPMRYHGKDYQFILDTGADLSTLNISKNEEETNPTLNFNGKDYQGIQTYFNTTKKETDRSGILGISFVEQCYPVCIDFNSMQLSFNNPRKLVNSSFLLTYWNFYQMRRMAEEIKQKDPGSTTKTLCALVSSMSNQPDSVLKYAPFMITENNPSMYFNGLTILQKALNDKGDYRNAATYSAKVVEYFPTVASTYPKDSQIRVKAIAAMDRALSGQPAVAVKIGKPEKIKFAYDETSKLYPVSGKIGKKKCCIALNPEVYYNTISLHEANRCGIRLLGEQTELNKDSLGCFGIADCIRIGNLTLANVPFWVYNDERPTSLGVCIMKQIPAMCIHSDKSLEFLPEAPAQNNWPLMRSDVVIYGETDSTTLQMTEQKFNNTYLFSSDHTITLDFKNMKYNIKEN